MSCDVPSPAIDVEADDLDDLSQSSSNMDQITYDRTGFFLAVSPEYEQEECNSYLTENFQGKSGMIEKCSFLDLGYF